jgi:PAS domain S-box-containing protein
MTPGIPASTKLRVLIVEHDIADAELNIHSLRSAGFEVSADVAETAVAFRRLLSANTYDVVLADYRLPSWTGMEALSELRSLGHDIPLILVTGTLGDERAVECVRSGAADYVLKDNISRLSIAVHRAVEEHRARAELVRAESRRREFEIEALEREAQFAQLADNISEVFYLVEADYSRTLYINKAYEEIWGRSRQSLYDNPREFVDALHPEDQPLLSENLRRVQRGEITERLDFRVVRPDGEIRWVTSRAVPIRNAQGQVYRISGVALDITEARSTRLSLEESEVRFRKLVDAAFDAIVISQMAIIREVNRGFVEMFGLASDREAIGRSVLEFCAPESRELVEFRIREEIDGAHDFVGLRADGTRILVEVTSRSHEVDGRPGRISALRNVTSQRTLEQQFRQAQKMEAVGRLAGGVAHDFNNLLVVISSYAQLILNDLGPHDPRRDDAAEILKASASAASLTRQLLAFSRQEVIQPRLVVLQELLSSSESMLQRLIGEDVELTTVLSELPLAINVDPGQFEQVIMNLAVNARDAMPTGGKLTIETALAEFDDAYANTHWPATPGRFGMVALSDTGHGMDEATQARIFEPFFTTKEVGKGTGLGLATVYGIIKQSGGFIWVYSEPGHGATFKVYLPLIDDAPELVNAPADVAQGPRGHEVVLVAEDAPAVRAVVRRILERLGYSVLEAPTGKAAIDIARRANPPVDLLMTDVVMPEMSGRDLAEQFVAYRPQGKVLYMSGYTDDAVLRHGVLSSGVEFIQKPFTPETLARKLRAILGPGPDSHGKA